MVLVVHCVLSTMPVQVWYSRADRFEQQQPEHVTDIDICSGFDVCDSRVL
jgi:hypothetical protein